MADAQSLPKAALYVNKTSIWASIPLLALEEKGYGPDEVDLKEVDLSTGENYKPEYMRLNSNATVPTLVVPLEKTLSSEIASRYKAIRDSRAIAEFLDKSRSAQSRTHTTSAAPAPALTPATIAFTAASNKIIEIIHSKEADPRVLTWFNGRDDASLKLVAAERQPIFQGKRDTLEKLIKGNDTAQSPVSEKTLKFWQAKKESFEGFIAIYKASNTPLDALDPDGKKAREEYYENAKLAWAALKDVLLQLHKEIIGPYVLGDQVSLADLHLAAWLTRIAKLAGATASDDGNTVTSKIEAHVGELQLPKDFSVTEARRRAGLPPGNVGTNDRQNRFAAFWDAMKERPSWKKVYAEGLH